jgi:tetratricopeptide (TPR) repeat protein
MKNLFAIAIFLLVISHSITANAQQSNDPETLVREGIALNDSGKYEEAIAKYHQALQIDSNYRNGYYEMSYTLFSSGREKEAIPFLNKLVALNPKSAEGFDMLGSIYDDDKQSDKAISYFLQAIQSDSTYQRAHFNLGITYYRTGKYAESEKCAIDAIKLDPKHASSQWLYGLAAYRLKKRGCSLLALCSFLMLEPNSKRAQSAIAYVKNIVNYGITRKDEKNVNITISPDNTSSLLMPMAVINATSDKKGLSPVDSLQLQLTELFKVSKSIVGDHESHFIVTYFANYFEALGSSGSMEAFTRYITLSAYKDENTKWFDDNKAKLTAFTNWLANTKRE